MLVINPSSLSPSSISHYASLTPSVLNDLGALKLFLVVIYTSSPLMLNREPCFLFPLPIDDLPFRTPCHDHMVNNPNP